MQRRASLLSTVSKVAEAAAPDLNLIVQNFELVTNAPVVLRLSGGSENVEADVTGET